MEVSGAAFGGRHRGLGPMGPKFIEEKVRMRLGKLGTYIWAAALVALVGLSLQSAPALALGQTMPKPRSLALSIRQVLPIRQLPRLNLWQTCQRSNTHQNHCRRKHCLFPIQQRKQPSLGLKKS